MSLAAAIDIGSNSVKLLVGRPTGGAVDTVLDEVVVTRLSEGVDATGRLKKAAAERTLEAIRAFVATARDQGVERFAAVGTAVLRDAEDGPEFIAACQRLGLQVEIVSGDTEAEIVRLAAVHEVDGIDGRAVLIDIGGGSTELVWPGGRESTQLGVVRLTERHVDQDPPGAVVVDRLTEVIDERLAKLDLPVDASALVGSSASCSLMARLDMGLTEHIPERIHGYRLPLRNLEALVGELAAMTQTERLAMTGMAPRRADVLLAGGLVLARAARAVGVDAVRINDRGTRYGIFHRAFTA